MIILSIIFLVLGALFMESDWSYGPIANKAALVAFLLSGIFFVTWVMRHHHTGQPPLAVERRHIETH